LSCVAIDTSPTQLNSTRRRVELCRYKHPLRSIKIDYFSPQGVTKAVIFSVHILAVLLTRNFYIKTMLFINKQLLL